MGFTITGLDPAPLLPLFDLTDAELAARDVRRRVADDRPGYPCRISLDDAAPGEPVLLLSYRHHPVASPYRGEGPIYVRRAAQARFVDALPPMLASRALSLRAYDQGGLLRDADLVPGADARGPLEALLAAPTTAYVHVHFARTGCFACRVDRA